MEDDRLAHLTPVERAAVEYFADGLLRLAGIAPPESHGRIDETAESSREAAIGQILPRLPLYVEEFKKRDIDRREGSADSSCITR